MNTSERAERASRRRRITSTALYCVFFTLVVEVLLYAAGAAWPAYLMAPASMLVFFGMGVLLLYVGPPHKATSRDPREP